MTRNQLPEGVGKKIVEALKRQAEADISPLDEEMTSIDNPLPLTNIENLTENKLEDLNAESNQNEDLIIEEETPVLQETIQLKEENKDELLNEPLFTPNEELKSVAKPAAEPVIEPLTAAPKQEKVEPIFFNNNISLNPEKIENKVMQKTNQISMPANVATLRNLILSLPSGVTKQTGAQIIKQTFEAMGLPMNSVLKEAQMFQEELNSSSREYMIKIQEYKTNIMQLEQSVQEYQKNISQVNDLISLFLIADK